MLSYPGAVARMRLWLTGLVLFCALFSALPLPAQQLGTRALIQPDTLDRAPLLAVPAFHITPLDRLLAQRSFTSYLAGFTASPPQLLQPTSLKQPTSPKQTVC
ncbi:hypothetical protein BH23GEM10_BH23GEM10_12070 [soil metagenome]